MAERFSYVVHRITEASYDHRDNILYLWTDQNFAFDIGIDARNRDLLLLAVMSGNPTWITIAYAKSDVLQREPLFRKIRTEPGFLKKPL